MNKSAINSAACDLVVAVEGDSEAMEHLHKGEVLFPLPFEAKDGTVLQVLCGSESAIRLMWDANRQSLAEDPL